MADIQSGNMILRSLYVPTSLDRYLKVLGFEMGKTKGELMRELMLVGLKEWRREGLISRLPPEDEASKGRRAALERAATGQVEPIVAADSELNERIYIAAE